MLENIDKLKKTYIYSSFHIFPSLIQISDKTPYQSSENNVQQQKLHFVLKLTDNMVNHLVNVFFKDRYDTCNIIMIVKLNGIASLYDLGHMFYLFSD
jgi:hypothetical protein